MSSTPNQCPICNNENYCGNREGKPHGTCWCDSEFFPKAIFDILPSDQLEKSCICKDCLDSFKKERKIKEAFK